jgi:hypothetical protein
MRPQPSGRTQGTPRACENFLYWYQDNRRPLGRRRTIKNLIGSCTLCRNRTVSLTPDHQGAQTHRDRPELSGSARLREALAFAITGRKGVLSELDGDAVAILTRA